MRKTITSESFWQVFTVRLTEMVRGLSDWQKDYDSDRGWTNLMMGVLKKIGCDLGFEGENEMSQEYLRLDLAYFKYPRRLAGDQTDNLWNLEVAIEHENHSERWFDEWVKLCHIGCGLKVLIAYHNYRDMRKSIDEKVKEANNFYRELHYKTSGAVLLILGPSSHDPHQPWQKFTMISDELRREPELPDIFPRKPTEVLQ